MTVRSKGNVTEEDLKEMEREDSSHRWLGWMAVYLGDIIARGGRITAITTEVEVIQEEPTDGTPFMKKRPGRGRTIQIEVVLPGDDEEEVICSDCGRQVPIRIAENPEDDPDVWQCGVCAAMYSQAKDAEIHHE